MGLKLVDYWNLWIRKSEVTFMIGVVISAHNEESHVTACLSSVCAAKHPALAGQAISIVVYMIAPIRAISVFLLSALRSHFRM